MAGVLVSSCGVGLLSSCFGQGFSLTLAMWGEALSQVWYVGSSLVVSSCTFIFVLWLLLSCSDVCLGSSLVVAWCSFLVVLRSYIHFP